MKKKSTSARKETSLFSSSQEVEDVAIASITVSLLEGLKCLNNKNRSLDKLLRSEGEKREEYGFTFDVNRNKQIHIEAISGSSMDKEEEEEEDWDRTS